MGVVRQDVKISAGYSGFIGSHSPSLVGHKTIVSLTQIDAASSIVVMTGSISSLLRFTVCCCSSDAPPAASIGELTRGGVFVGVSAGGAVRKGTNTPAEEQSRMTIVGFPTHCRKSDTDKGMYSV